MVRKGVVLAGTVLALVGPAAAAASAPRPDLRGCRHAFTLPTGRNDAAIRRAVTCLVNVQRYAHGVPLLRPSPRLRRAAEQHCDDMAARGYFAHQGPGGPTLAERLQRAGFEAGTAGEVLARAEGLLSSPFGIVVAWLHSPEHRANLLDRRFTRLGNGVAAGESGAIYTTNLGTPY